MGVQEEPQNSLFSFNVSLDKRVRSNHPLRKILSAVDFDFSYSEVKKLYGKNGNESVPPPVILKLMLLLVFYNVRSERELMETVPERLDWLWFLGYNLDSTIPNHSVLSKARKKWGVPIFQSFFQRIVTQCVEAGLVDGNKIFMDSSLVDANASSNSVVDKERLKAKLHKDYQKLEARLHERDAPGGDYDKKNAQFISTTDPDATIVNRGKPILSYQVHRAVDGKNEVITATDVTTGIVNEADLMLPLVKKHEAITGIKVDTIVADSKYGIIDNYLACFDRGLNAHVPEFGKGNKKRMADQNIFQEHQFLYDQGTDTYLCPAGNLLKRKTVDLLRNCYIYSARKKVCKACTMRDQCTTGKSGRTLRRHWRHDDLKTMRDLAESPEAQKDIKTRQHLMERSFAKATRYAFDRARWRGLWRMRIQELLVCVIQNIQVLVKHREKPQEVRAMRIAPPKVAFAAFFSSKKASFTAFCFC